MSKTTTADVPSGFIPFHSSEDSDRLLPAIGFGSRAVIFVDKEGDLVTLAGVLAARCEQLRALVSMLACVSDGSDMHGNAVAACLEPSVELLFHLSEIVSNRLARERRLAEFAQAAAELDQAEGRAEQ